MSCGIRKSVYLLLIVAVAAFSGCGGGGGGSSSAGDPPASGTTLPSRVLNWVSPTTYIDSTPMNPVTDLDRFEIYVNETGSFTGTEPATAALGAVDSSTGKLTTSFDLARLAPALTVGPHYFVSMRAVALNGQKSDFSSPISFSF